MRRFAGPAALFMLAALAVARSATAEDPPKVEWSAEWPRVRLWETIAALGLTFGDTLFEDRVPLPAHAAWTQPILFDSWARDTFRGRTAGLQSFASSASDWMFRAGALVPFVVDDWFGAAGVHQNADVALQLAVIDLQSFGIAGLLSLAAEHGVGRRRPYVESCNAEGHVLDVHGQVMQTCGTGNDFRSFYSGHAAATATTAGLVCVHHQHLPLFGGGVADLAPCLVMIGVSATTGVLRLVYDEHWASDVIVGWIDGILSGYVLPSLLHFGFGGQRAVGEIRSGTLHLAPTLLPIPGGSEIGWVGVF